MSEETRRQDLIAKLDARDQQGHLWRETVVGDLFPLVCARCLTRSDRGAAWLPCDALVDTPAPHCPVER